MSPITFRVIQMLTPRGTLFNETAISRSKRLTRIRFYTASDLVVKPAHIRRVPLWPALRTSSNVALRRFRVEPILKSSVI